MNRGAASRGLQGSQMRITVVASEAVPFAKTGGLADVAGALPCALSHLGHEVSLILPHYRQVRTSGQRVRHTGVSFQVPVGREPARAGVAESRLPDADVPVYLVENGTYFDRDGLYGTAKGDYPDNCARFAFFARATIEVMKRLELAPQVIHCNDWQTGLIPAYVRLLADDNGELDRAGLLFTVHNLAYQGLFPADEMDLIGLSRDHLNMHELEFHGQLSFIKGGLVFGDVINTVSERHAHEIQQPEFGAGLDGVLRSRSADVHGVVNGIDYAVWNPETDPHIAASYGPTDLHGKRLCKRELQRLSRLPERDVPLLAMISRLDPQKGLDLVCEALPDLMNRDVQFVLLGTGNGLIQKRLEALGRAFPDKAAMHITYDNVLAHQIEAGADMLLMPSRYEPCGLSQLYSLKYGAAPIVRAVGGLADTVVNCTSKTLEGGTANGFTFKEYSSDALLDVVRRAVTLHRDRAAWERLMKIGMTQDWSWSRSAKQYVTLYMKAAARRGAWDREA